MFDSNSLWQFDSTNSKLEYKYANEIKSDYEKLFSEIFPNINLEANTPQGQIINYLTQIDLDTISGFQDILNYFFLGGNGKLLDIWAYNQYRATRKQGINGNVLIKIHGVPNTLVPKGFIVSDGNLEYESENDLTISENGEVSANFKCKVVTQDVSLENTINEIVTNIIGVERVTNPNPSNAGIETESDSAFYNRLQRYGSLFKNSSLQSILSNVANIKGTNRISGYENVSSENITIQNYTINTHAFVIIVEGGDDVEIANTIADSKAPGPAMMGTTKITLIRDNKEIEYRFQRPRIQHLTISVNCKLDLRSPQNYQSQIKEAIQLYLADLKIGATITQPDLSNAIVKYIQGFTITDLRFAYKGEAPGYAPLILDLDKIAVAENDDIKITGN